MARNKEAIKQFDFIRAVACIGIVLYHFSVESGWFNIIRVISGGGTEITWGDIYVTVFFAISGALLHYNNAAIPNVKNFYKKRLATLLPPYYIAWGSMYILSVVKNKSVFYKGHPLSILLSFIGMDGYLSYRVTNYYILGEWFVGAIILLYLIYPMILWCDKKQNGLLTIAIVFSYIVSLKFSLTGMPSFRTIPSCLISFYIGFLLVEHHDKLNKGIFLSVLIITVVFTQLRIGNPNICAHILGILMAILLYGIGTVAMQIGFVEKVMNWISKKSYYIFLTHHVVICQLLKKFQFSQNIRGKFVSLIITLMLSLICAELLRVIVTRMLKIANTIRKEQCV